MEHTEAQRYFSTRGGYSGLSYEEVILKGLSDDGGLFIPEQIPKLPADWSQRWRDLTFQELAFEILSMYISPLEIPSQDLKGIIERSYKHFRAPEITPLITLDREKQLFLLELFHGVTYAFKDVALQFLGELFEYFLVRRNEGKEGKGRVHLSIIGATSGDTGSAAIYGLRGRQDLSIFMLFPDGKVSNIQESQMTTILDPNVINIAVEGTFDDCQDTVKALFADPETNKNHKLAAVNSISWARINAQMVYYFHAYFSLLKSPNYDLSKGIDFVVPSGNFGDILAGWFAKSMGLPISRLVIATNSNDILDRFMNTGNYSKQPISGPKAEGGFAADGVKSHPGGVKETLAPAMDILISSNFERLLAYLAIDIYAPVGATIEDKLKIMQDKVVHWLQELKHQGGFTVDKAILEAARKDFSSERVDDAEILSTTKSIYHSCSPKVAFAEGTTGKNGGYILDPHSAIGVCASLRHVSASSQPANTIALATAHPAKFANAVNEALTGSEGYDFQDILPAQFKAFKDMPKRVKKISGADKLQEIKELMNEKILRER